jgi:hypothetical protein
LKRKKIRLNNKVVPIYSKSCSNLFQKLFQFIPKVVPKHVEQLERNKNGINKIENRIKVFIIILLQLLHSNCYKSFVTIVILENEKSNINAILRNKKIIIRNRFLNFWFYHSNWNGTIRTEQME